MTNWFFKQATAFDSMIVHVCPSCGAMHATSKYTTRQDIEYCLVHRIQIADTKAVQAKFEAECERNRDELEKLFAKRKEQEKSLSRAAANAYTLNKEELDRQIRNQQQNAKTPFNY
jgi:arsenate reductase-like glutaredoxin family protein